MSVSRILHMLNAALHAPYTVHEPTLMLEVFTFGSLLTVWSIGPIGAL